MFSNIQKGQRTRKGGSSVPKDPPFSSPPNSHALFLLNLSHIYVVIIILRRIKPEFSVHETGL